MRAVSKQAHVAELLEVKTARKKVLEWLVKHANHLYNGGPEQLPTDDHVLQNVAEELDITSVKPSGVERFMHNMAVSPAGIPWTAELTANVRQWNITGKRPAMTTLHPDMILLHGRLGPSQSRLSSTV